jgi:DNA replication and repair protein RecF
VVGAPVTHSLQAAFSSEGRKELRIDGTTYHGFVHLIGGLRVIQFNFSSLFLVKGMPSVRRQYINLLIASCSRPYLETLSSYSAAVMHKNALLRQASGGGSVDLSLLDLYDEQIATLSNTVYDRRSAVLTAVNQAMKRLIAEGLFQQLADVSIVYDPRPVSVDSIRAIRERELARHVCLEGCHLDDFILLRGNRQLRDTASLGEAKLIALLLTFAGAEYVRTVTGEYPILLLDDLEGDIDRDNLSHLTQLLARFEQVFVASFDFGRLESGLNAVPVHL